MKIYDKCPGCDESVSTRKPITRFECGSWIGLDGVLAESNPCLRRQRAQSQARIKELQTALAVIELSYMAMQERAEAAEAVVREAYERERRLKLKQQIRLEDVDGPGPARPMTNSKGQAAPPAAGKDGVI